ncbi:MAG: glycerophosphodiester phosphodiesterase [Acidimicrobiia bacterium]|nr:glycerophosphodiester phosphodiesterase [Acidimicrobiia bacterium]
MALITFAHRGARAHLPENTLPAFRYALEHGARGLETDARRSADGEVVLAHDEWLRARIVGIVPWRLRVPATSAERLGRHGAPRLVDLYDQLGSDYELSIDLKAPDIGQQVIELARERGDAHRLWLCSASTTRLRGLREEAIEVKLVHSQLRSRLSHTIERHAADLAAARINAMNMHHSEWSRGLVELFHRFEVRAFAWDVQEVRHLRSMLGIGIDAVYCDDVDRMVASVAEWTTGGPPSEAQGDAR